MESKGGLLLKRKDFLGVDEEAGSHPNRTYYFKKNSDDLNKIILTCSKTLRNEPYDKESLLLRGTTYLKMDRYKEAVDDFTDLLSMDPTLVETYYKRGVAYTKLGAQDAAISDFTKVLDFNPDHVNAAFSRAACYNTIGQFSRAIEDYNTALLKDQRIVSMSGSRPGTPNPKQVVSRYPEEERSNRAPRPSSAEMEPVSYSETSNERLRGGVAPSKGDLIFNPQMRSPEPQRAVRMPAPSSRTPLKTTVARGLEPQLSRLEYGNGNYPLPSPPQSGGRHRQESEDENDNDNSTIISGITFMSNVKGGGGYSYMDSLSPGDNHSPLAQLPLSSDEYHQKGYEFRRQGKFESAILEYSKAIQKDPQHFKALFNRAFAMDKLGEYKEAIKDYTRALEVDPNNAYAFYNRGISHDRQKNYFEASIDFKQAIKLSPNNLDFLHNLALCLRKMGQTEDALASYSQCLRVDPSHVKARHGRAMCNETLKLYDKALQDYDIILSQNPQHMLCMVSRAHLLHRMSYSNQTPVTTQHTDQTSHPSHHFSDEAFVSFSKSLEILCPDVQALINSISSHSSNLSAVGSVSSQANGNVSRCTECISILYARAKILEDRGDNNAAIQDLTSAVRLASALVKVQDSNFLIPKSSTSNIAVDMQDHPCLSLYLLFYNRALCWKASDQYNNAMTDLTTSLKLISDELYGLQSRTGSASSHDRMQTLTNALNNAYNHRGFCFRKMENFDDAIKDYTQAIRAVPGNARALNNRAYCFAKKELFAEAVADYTAVIEIDPYNSHSYHNRGISLDKLGKADDALADFAKVIELDSSVKPSNESEQIDISSSFRERYANQEPLATSSTASSHLQHQQQQQMPPSPSYSPSPFESTVDHNHQQQNHTTSNSHSSNRQQDPRSVTTVNSFPSTPTPSLHSTSSNHSSSSFNSISGVSSTTQTRKPRRPPPSRPTKPPSPGPHLSPRPAAPSLNHANIVTETDSPLQPVLECQSPSAAMKPPAAMYSPQRRHPPKTKPGVVQPGFSSSASPLDSLASSFGKQVHVNYNNNPTTGGRSTHGSLVEERNFSQTGITSSDIPSTQGTWRANFEPIRMSSRGSTPKNNRPTRSNSTPTRGVDNKYDVESLFVENSYNTRSFYDRNLT